MNSKHTAGHGFERGDTAAEVRQGGAYRMTVYLAGPIDNVSGEESSGWREKVKEALPDINFLDPLRRKWEGFNYDTGQWNEGADPSIDDFTEIVERDKADISDSDIVLVYHNKPGVGTSMEILYAFELGKYVLTIGCTGRPLSPWILYHSTKIVKTLDEAIDALKDISDQYDLYELDDWGDEI